MLEIVKNGYISDAFPLYKSWYDYTRLVYPDSELHTAEALLTVLHLSQIGQSKPQSLQWIRDRIAEGQIWSAYDTAGNPTKRYESTAVYAIAAMIAKNEGDMVLASRAIEKMEQLKLRQFGNPLDGAFGNGDGSGMIAFDQLMAWCAYEQMEK